MAEPILTDKQRAALYERIDALPPLSDEQLDAVADVLLDIQLSRADGEAE